MKIHYLQADCGAGKTYSTLSNIAANPGRYVFAVNKIDLIGERIREFNEFAGSDDYRIAQIHSQIPHPMQVSVGIAKIKNRAIGNCPTK